MNIRRRFSPIFSTLPLLLLALSLLAACGGSPEGQPSGSDDQRAASSGSVPSSDEACDAFASASGFGGFPGGFANMVSGAQGGPTIQSQYSDSPPSDEAEQIASFFENALDEAFDADVSAECYWEVSASQSGESGRALWVSLRLPSEPSSEVVQAIQDSLRENGATIQGFTSTLAGGEAAAVIMVTELPLDLQGDLGGMLMFTEDYAVLIAGQGMESGSGQPSQMPPSAPPTAPTSAPQTQQVSADAQGLIEWFQDNLEEALNVTLEVEGSLQSSGGGQGSLLITFLVPEGSPLPSDVADRFEGIAESANATITAKIGAGGLSIVNFENLEIEGITASGSMTFTGDQNNILVSLQY